MPNYVPTPRPDDPKQLAEYTHRELRRVGDALRDKAEFIHYDTSFQGDASLSNGISANWKCANKNIIRCSTSATITIGGIAYKEACRIHTYMNVGTGVLAFKNEDTSSSASFRLALPAALYQISAGHCVSFWHDPVSSRKRVLSRS
jgi:hypothetical protein